MLMQVHKSVFYSVTPSILPWSVIVFCPSPHPKDNTCDKNTDVSISYNLDEVQVCSVSLAGTCSDNSLKKNELEDRTIVTTPTN